MTTDSEDMREGGREGHEGERREDMGNEDGEEENLGRGRGQ